MAMGFDTRKLVLIGKSVSATVRRKAVSRMAESS